MITEASGGAGLLTAIDKTQSQFVQLMLAIDEKEVNTVPYKDSWTPGELLRHITKSTLAIANALKQKGKPAQRNADEKIPELRKTFLDFSHKMKSPDFIIPEKGPYERLISIKEFKQAFQDLEESTGDANLEEIVEGLPIGEVTKLELLHFVLYHTERHLHQMNNIFEALKNK